LPLNKTKTTLYEVARKILEAATTTALGPTCNTVIEFHLKQKFGRDPCEVFVEDPTAFYTALKEIFGAGAESIISLVGTFLVNKYGMTASAETFLNLVVKGDESSKSRLEEILSRIAHQTEN
jgi:hypothetical protein